MASSYDPFGCPESPTASPKKKRGGSPRKKRQGSPVKKRGLSPSKRKSPSKRGLRHRSLAPDGAMLTLSNSKLPSLKGNEVPSETINGQPASDLQLELIKENLRRFSIADKAPPVSPAVCKSAPKQAANHGIAYKTRHGVTSSDLQQWSRNLQLVPAAKWKQCFGRRDERDLPPEVSAKLERSYQAGLLKCGVWDNGLYRDFDLAKMQEIPGCKELRRVSIVEDKPWSAPTSF